MNACVCGHSIEEHEDERGQCSGEVRRKGKTEPCRCVAYEEEAEEEEAAE